MPRWYGATKWPVVTWAALARIYGLSVGCVKYRAEHCIPLDRPPREYDGVRERAPAPRNAEEAQRWRVNELTGKLEPVPC